MKLTILIKNAVFVARHGVYREEARLGQRFEVDLEVDAEVEADAEHDDWRLTVGYDRLYATMAQVVNGPRYRLIEALADAIIRAILKGHPKVARVRIEIRKPSAPLAAIIDHAAVRLERSRDG